MTYDGKPSRNLTRQEREAIVRQLRTIRYSPRAPRIGRRVPGIRTVARQAGLSFRTVYTIVQTGRLTPAQALALARALEAVQDWPCKVLRPPRPAEPDCTPLPAPLSPLSLTLLWDLRQQVRLYVAELGSDTDTDTDGCGG
jgi:hypothetical protein